MRQKQGGLGREVGLHSLSLAFKINVVSMSSMPGASRASELSLFSHPHSFEVSGGQNQVVKVSCGHGK